MPAGLNLPSRFTQATIRHHRFASTTTSTAWGYAACVMMPVLHCTAGIEMQRNAIAMQFALRAVANKDRTNATHPSLVVMLSESADDL